MKSIGRRRVSHVDDVCLDPALATFAGLESLPKASSLGSYSYRLTRSHDEELLAGLARSMIQTGQTRGADFDLDFHAIMHFGDDVALENHYVPRRSQRTEAVLSFFVQDSETRNLLYANAACTKADQARQVIAFARHWEHATGHPPELLVFDSKVTTGAGLAELERRRTDIHHDSAPATPNSPANWRRCPTVSGHRSPSTGAAPTPNRKSTNRTSPSAAARSRYARSPSADSDTTTRH